MKIVEFTRDMAPHVRGESRIVPDGLADALTKAGDVTNVRNWPETEQQHEQPRPKRHERHHR